MTATCAVVLVCATGRVGASPPEIAAVQIARVDSVTTAPGSPGAPGSIVPVAAMTTEAYVDELEIAAGLDTLNGGGRFVMHDQVVERTDTTWRTLDSLVRQHVADLRGKPLEPRYFLGLAHLELQLGQDAAAEQHVTAWLTSPGVTTQDSITALGMAVGLFLRQEVTTARIAVARRYLNLLATFPPPAALAQLYAGRFKMMGAFDGRGQSDSAAVWGLKAYALLKDMRYAGRVYCASEREHLETMVRVLAGQPHGAARRDSLLTVLRGYLRPPSPADLAADDWLRENQSEVAKQVQFAQVTFARIASVGQPMPPFVATHWLNHDRPSTASNATPGARILPLNDGVIRIIGFGWLDCPHCQDMMREMQRVRAQVPPGVQFLYYDIAQGYFNGDICTPEEEAENLRKWYLEGMQLTFPIALWVPVKDSTPGGAVRPRQSPLWEALHVTAGPTIYIVDGQGVIQYRGEGFERFDEHSQLSSFRRALEAVVRERDARAAPTTVQTTTQTTTQVTDEALRSPSEPLGH